MRTVSKVFLVLTLAVVHTGCRSWCGDCCHDCLTDAPAWKKGAVAVSTVPDANLEQVGLYSAAQFVGAPTASQN